MLLRARGVRVRAGEAGAAVDGFRGKPRVVDGGETENEWGVTFWTE